MVYEGRMSRVDRPGIHREAAQLGRDPLEGNDGLISGRRWSEQLIPLDVECGQYCGEQTPLDSTGNGQHSQKDNQH